MEIEIEAGKFRDDYYYQIDKFVFSALCILGTEYEPCFESAGIGRHYTLGTFKREYTQMLGEYKKYIESAANRQANSTEKNKETKEVKGADMNITAEIREQIKKTMTEAKYRSSSEHYYEKYIVLGVSDSEITAIDREDRYKIYSIPYVATESNGEVILTVNYEKKAEKSLIAGEKTESVFDVQGEIETVTKHRLEYALANHDNAVIKDLEDALVKKEAEYTLSEAENRRLREQISIFVAEKAELQRKNHKDAVDAMINTYTTIMSGCGEFDEYRARLTYGKTLEETEQELKVIYATYSLAQEKERRTKFSLDPKEYVESGIVGNGGTDDAARKRYGSAFDGI